MYRVNPFTYVVDGLLSTTLAQTTIRCAENEYLTFDPPSNKTCGEYMAPFISQAGGYLLNNDTMSGEACQYCKMRYTDDFLAGINVTFAYRWRNFGFMWAFIAFNIAAAVLIYWAVRVPKGKKVN